MRRAAASGDAQIVYTDHDVLNESGERCAPYFKPDWSLDLFLAQMYMGHLIVLERSLVEEVGGLLPSMDGAQDYDLMLALRVARSNDRSRAEGSVSLAAAQRIHRV